LTKKKPRSRAKGLGEEKPLREKQETRKKRSDDQRLVPLLDQKRKENREHQAVGKKKENGKASASLVPFTSLEEVGGRGGGDPRSRLKRKIAPLPSFP